MYCSLTYDLSWKRFHVHLRIICNSILLLLDEMFTIYIFGPFWFMGFPVAQMVKNPPAMQRPVLIPMLGRSLREGNGYLLQYSCLENPHGQKSLVAIVYGVAKSWVWLSNLSTWIPWSRKKVTNHKYIKYEMARVSWTKF